MKKILTTLLISMLTTLMYSQTFNQAQSSSSSQKQVVIKLKNGATIKGELKSLDPLGDIVLIIAGKDTTIPMEKVDNLETLDASQPSQVTNTASESVELGNKKLIVTDNASYPEKITVNIGNAPVEMILVRGGKMNMGFDGKHSLAMNSEPVHKVSVTSFYMSVEPLSAEVIEAFDINVKKLWNSKIDNGKAVINKYNDVEAIIKKIESATGKCYRLPTEAEWEFAACSEVQNLLFAYTAKNKKYSYEWCSDYFAEFKGEEIKFDPTGPVSGKEHVLRAYNNQYGKLDRDSNHNPSRYLKGFIRLVIKAKDV